ncbi:MAG: hypothetical protein A2020_00685 [Lentisphaerae bacterium GWF2_45_14]|nr:MAG: hypothetical protein A2020_00685 [Lentisphaerae bacterium GWF2_45_14]
MAWTDEVYSIRKIPPGSRIDLQKALSFYTEESVRKMKNTFQKLAADGGSDDLELEMITAKNKKIWVRVTFVAQKENGKTIRVSGIIQDITERKNIEKLREDFERITRHDLKTPLNSIFVASQLLDRTKLSEEETRKVVHIIKDSVYKLLDMINLSLDLSRIEDGAYNILPVPFNFKDLMMKVINDHRVCAEIKKVEVNVDYSASAFTVNGEENLMYSMLSNLYKNAIEASPSGEKIEIKIDKNAEGYVIEINNKGTVPPELRDRFFDKYATAGKENGTGLGTYNTKLITELHNGKISMTSSEELGTSVIIELPRNLDERKI